MEIVVSYGLPGSGKTTLMRDLILYYDLDKSSYISFDDPISRKFIKRYFLEDLIEEDKIIYVDFLLQDPHKLLQIISDRSFKNITVTIHQFIPDITACLINVRKRGREIDASPTIKNMKIKLLNDHEISKLYPKIITNVITHETYKK
jgi:hypothetical protein